MMPAQMFRHLHDDDVARILAWARTVPASGAASGQTNIRLMGRALIAMNQIKAVARQIDDAAGEPADPPGRGAYLAMNACSECHGQDLHGRPEAHAPSLVAVNGYSAEQFARLMHDGVGVGEREFELMTPTAKARFSHLTADEVQALYEFLQSRFQTQAL